MKDKCKGCNYLESNWCHLYNLNVKKAIEHCKEKSQA